MSDIEAGPYPQVLRRACKCCLNEPWMCDLCKEKEANRVAYKERNWRGSRKDYS